MRAAPAAAQADHPQAQILGALAERTLRAHLQNRRQLLDPPPAGLAGLGRAQRALLVRVMVAAAQASGELTPLKIQRIERALAVLGGAEEEREVLAAARRDPVPLETLLREVRDEQTASRVYAASMLATNRYARVDRAWLHYLACRLGLSPEVVAKLQRLFGHVTISGAG